MSDKATIIAADLDDKSLNQSINSLIATINQKTDEMAKSFDRSVGKMTETITKLVQAGESATKSSENRRKANMAESQSAKNLTNSYDSLAGAMQKANASQKRFINNMKVVGSGSNFQILQSNVDPNKQYPLYENSKQTQAQQLGEIEQAEKRLLEIKQKQAQAQRDINNEQQKTKAGNDKGTYYDYSTLGTYAEQRAKQHQNLGNNVGKTVEEYTKLERVVARYLGVSAQELNLMTRAGSSYNALSQSLQKMVAAYHEMTATERNSSQGKMLVDNIQRVQRQIQKIQTQMNRPTSMNSVLGMSESNLDNIRFKLQAIANMRGQFAPQSEELKRLNKEYERLSNIQNKALGRIGQMTNGTLALASAMRYLRNRILYAFTVGAATQFVKQLIEVRGQYELLERSIGVLVDNAEAGTRIFNELNQLALKSPYTTIELAGAAKQLSAYNFGQEEIVDTTKRLADIASALGVPMERLVYNLGQIKAQGVLNARDARDFANAGFAIVPMLAQMYTQEKRRGDQLVKTADVYDMISKKMVSYADVMRVITQQTDEGGKFFDFQAKQADTLKVRMANLQLAYQNMLNDIGKDTQSPLMGMLNFLRTLLTHWRQVIGVIRTVIIAFVGYKATLLAVAIAQGKLNILGMAKSFITMIKAIRGSVTAMRALNAVMATNAIGFVITLIATAASLFATFSDSMEEASEAVEKYGESGAKTLSKINQLQAIIKATEETSETHKKALEELNGILQEYGLEGLKEGEILDDNNEKRKEAIALIKEESIERNRANNIEKASESYRTRREELTADFKGDALSYPRFRQWEAEIKSGIPYIVEGNLDKTREELLTMVETFATEIGIKNADLNTLMVMTARYIGEQKELYESEQKSIDAINKASDVYKKQATNTMTASERLAVYRRQLGGVNELTSKLYNNVSAIVKSYAKEHNIDFKVRFLDTEIPSWMEKMSLEQLKSLATSFGAALKEAERSGAGMVSVSGKVMSVEEVASRAMLYAKQAQLIESQIDDKNKNKTTGVKKDPMLDALREEKKIIEDTRKTIDDYRKSGVPSLRAMELASDQYGETLAKLNPELRKFGFNTLTMAQIANMTTEEMLRFWEQTLNVAKGKGSVKSLELIENEVASLNKELAKENYKRFVDGLNNELNRLKEGYALSVEMEANPELGNFMASMFDIPTDNIPRTYSEMLDKANAIAREKLKELGVEIADFDFLSTKIEFNEKGLWNGLTKEGLSEIIKWQNEFKKSFKSLLLDTEKDFNDYISKNGVLSDRLVSIERERLKKLTTLNDAYKGDRRKTQEYISKLKAINKGAEREAGDARFDAFKESRFYVAMFDDIEHASTASLNMILQRLDSLKDSMSSLSPDQMKWIVQQWNKINDEVVRRNPFKGLAKNAKDYFKAISNGKKIQKEFAVESQKMEEMVEELSVLSQYKTFEDRLKSGLVGKETEGLEIERIAKLTGITAEQAHKIVDEYKAKGKPLDETLSALREELNLQTQIVNKKEEENEKNEDTIALFSKQLEGVSSRLQQIASITGSITDIGEAMGLDEAASEKRRDITESINGLASVAKGYGEMASGNYVAGIASALQGVAQIVKTWSDNGNKSIDRQIKRSETNVKRLELGYKSLAHAQEESYGTTIYAAEMAIVANKKLQLAEMERQLQLEQSRSAKNKDTDKIIDLQGKIRELRYEITDASRDVVNKLLDISSAGSFAEELVQNIASAFRQGEDYMKEFGDAWEQMVDSLIMKSIASNVVGNEVDKLVKKLENRLAEKGVGSEEESEYIKAVQLANDIPLQSGGQFTEWVYRLRRLVGTGNEEVEKVVARLQAVQDYANEIGKSEFSNIVSEFFSPFEEGGAFIDKDFHDKVNEAYELYEEIAKARYDAKMAIEDEDIQFVQRESKAIQENVINPLMEELKKWYEQGTKDAESLSSLQQGISGITEDTAGAIEAYLNGISQQVYLHSDLLTQIRNAILSFNSDVILDVQGQMLSQLQQSYQIQSSIHNILNGVLSSNGRSFNVEIQ